jgi:hypothetical protein
MIFFIFVRKHYQKKRQPAHQTDTLVVKSNEKYIQHYFLQLNRSLILTNQTNIIIQTFRPRLY